MSEKSGFNWKAIFIVAGILLFAGKIYFIYRYLFVSRNVRRIPHDDKVFVSPANGKVIAIRPYTEASFIETKDSPETERGAMKILTSDVAPAGTIITIAINLDDVHTQRAPISGQVLNTQYIEGNFNDAINMPGEQSSRYENEHNEILLQGPDGSKYKVVQIAGFVARSIKCAVKPGDNVKQGQILGSIEIGSQVTVIIPSQFQVTANIDDYLIDGETIIARVQ